MSPSAFVFTAAAVLASAVLHAAPGAAFPALGTTALRAVMLLGALGGMGLARRRGYRIMAAAAMLVTFLLGYLVLRDMIERTDATVVSVVFLTAVLAVGLLMSMATRARHAVELGPQEIHLDSEAGRLIDRAATRGNLTVIPVWPGAPQPFSIYRADAGDCPRKGASVLLLEVTLLRSGVTSSPVTNVVGHLGDGQPTLRVNATDTATTIAALLFHIRDRTGQVPRAEFAWTECRPWTQLAAFLLSSPGAIALSVREVLFRAEPDPGRRPTVHLS